MSPFSRSASCLGLLASLASLQTGARPSAQTLWTCEADIVFEGSVPFDHRGWGLDTSGNWNGDAYASGQPMQDILVGGFQTECDLGSAELFISREMDGGFPIAQTCPFSGGRVRIVGEQVNDLFGYSVAFVGDIDGDDRDDFAVSMVRGLSDCSTGTQEGAVYVFLSGDAGTGIPAEAPASGTATAYAAQASLIIRENVDATGRRFGLSLAGIGDWEGDGDGVPDFLVGAPGNLGDFGGLVYMISGAQVLAAMATSSEAVVTDVLVGDQLEPGSPPGIIAGAPGDRMGYAVAHVGEVGGTTHGSDFAVGAPQFNDPSGNFLGFNDTSTFPRPGYIKVFRGQDLPAIQLLGTQPKQRFGFSIAGKANVDNAGLDEVIVGSPFWDVTAPANNNAGKVSVYSGGTLSLIGEMVGSVIPHSPTQERLGFGVSGLADFNGGGDEFAVGSFGFESTPLGPFSHPPASPCWPCPEYVQGQAAAVGGLISGRCQVVTYNGSNLSPLAAYVGDFRDSAGSFVSFLPAAGPSAQPAVVVSGWRWGDSSSPALNEVGRIQLFLWP